MLRPPPFPISIHELTAETLTEGIGVPVEGFSATQIGADRGMLGEIFLLDLTYAAGATGPDQVVAKFAALREGSLASARRGGAHERELRCFDELLPDTPVSAPANHGTWYDPASAHFLLLQGAIPNDDTVDQVAGLGIDDAKLVLREMARLHARWWGDTSLTRLDWLPRLDGPGRVHNLATFATNGWAPMCEMVGDELTPAEQALGADLPARLEQSLHLLACLPHTLIHSDLRADNLLFAPDHSGVTFVDWQGCGVGPPAFDIAYFLVQSLTVETRRRYEDELIDFYRAELSGPGATASREAVVAGYAESAWYSLTIACALPLISDPSEPRVQALATAIARRSIEALRDHNQLWETTT